MTPSLLGAVAGAAVIASGGGAVVDSFDRANGAIGTADSGHVWTVHTGTWTVDTNRARLDGVGNVGGSMTAELGTSSQAVSAVFPSGNSSSHYWQILGRVSADGSASVALFMRPGGMITIRTTTNGDVETGRTLAAGERLGLVLYEEGSASRYTVTINNLPVYTYLETSGSRPMGTRVGLAGWRSDNHTFYFEDFLADEVESPSTSAITPEFLQFTTPSGADSTTVTVASVNLGAPAVDRSIVIIAGQWTAATPVSATIGGQPVIWDVHRSSSPHLYIGRAVVPFGSTGTVTFTWSASVTPARSGFALYRVTGGTLALSATSEAGPASAPSTTVTVPPGGFAAVGSYLYGDTCSWSGITEDFDQALGIMAISGGDSAAEGDLTVAPTWTTINSPPHLGAVAFDVGTRRSISDSFTRPNSSSLLSAADTGQAWSVAGGETWGVSSNAAYKSSGGANRTVATINFGQADMVVQAVFVGTNDFQHLVARWVDLDNTYQVVYRSTTGSSVSRRIAGVSADIGAITIAPGDVIALSLAEEGEATRVIAFRNGVAVYNALDTTPGRPAGTRGGFAQVHANQAFFDAFSITAPRAGDPSLLLSLDAGHVGSWPGSGSTWFDLTKSNRDATLTGVAYSADGGGSMVFTRSESDYASLAHAAALSLASGAGTISCWVKPTAGAYETAFVEHGYYTGDGGWMLWYVSGQVRFYIRKASRVAAAISTGVWTHVVATLDGANVKIYLNGAAPTTAAYAQYPADVSEPVQIGRYGGGGGTYHDGQINDVRLYARALSASKVTALYNETKARYGH